jgi:hypothetical protein
MPPTNGSDPISNFDIIILDEAGQSPEPYVWNLLAGCTPRVFLQFGDPRLLPLCKSSRVEENNFFLGLRSSMFARVRKAGFSPHHVGPAATHFIVPPVSPESPIISTYSPLESPTSATSPLFQETYDNMASDKKGESARDKVSEYVFPGPEGSSDQLGPKAYANKSNINKFKFIAAGT